MFINRTVTKKVLENLIRETFLKFGSFSSSSLLDSLKFLGFHYATNAGISISIEDLKTPDVKDLILSQTLEEIEQISNDWQQGLVTDIERFQTIIDSWNVATESLKNRIVDYYQNFDPANNLYIMAFSGARGNMSQVRQLVGMRGLMADQSGKIIDLPIQTNFREGLTPIDYIISAYGARKGIVDTALKTADSGYLTRRLIYVAQDLVIRELDCKTNQGVLIFFDKKRLVNGLFGRTLLSATKYSGLKKISLIDQEILFTPTKLKELQTEIPLLLNFRSSLTCRSMNSICQKCYGWDLSQQRLVSLGEAVGIIAAQSIGEPGTQLTMRTFHTGGIFTGETIQQIVSPFSGKFFFPDPFQGISFRTNHGQIVFKLTNETEFRLVDWKGYEEIISLNPNSYLYLSQSCFLKKGQVIAEYSPITKSLGEQRLKPLFSSIGGEVLYERIKVKTIEKDGTKPISIIQRSGSLWILAGSLFDCQSEALLSVRQNLSSSYPILKLKVCSPFEGYFYSDNDQNLVLSIFGCEQLVLDSEFLKKEIKDDFVGYFLPIIRSYQKIDKGTILGYWYVFPKESHILYQLKKKEASEEDEKDQSFCLYSDQNSWNFFLEEPEQKPIRKLKKTSHISSLSNSHSFITTSASSPLCILKSKKKVRKTTRISSTLLLHRFGVFSFRKGAKIVFHKATSYFMNSGTTVSYQPNDYILRNSLLANLINYTQRTEDIVQGLPKIERLVEASVPEFKATLASSPGPVLPTLTLCPRVVYLEKKQSQPQKNLWVFRMDWEPFPIKVKILKKYNKESEEAVLIRQEARNKKQLAAEEEKLKKREQPARNIRLARRLFLKEMVILKKDNKCYTKQWLSSKLKMVNPITKQLSKSLKWQRITRYGNARKNNIRVPDICLEIKDMYTPGIRSSVKNEKKEFKQQDFITSEKRNINIFVKASEDTFPSLSPDLLTIYCSNHMKTKPDMGKFLLEYKDERLAFLKEKKLISNNSRSPGFQPVYKPGQFVDLGEPLSRGMISMHDLLQVLFSYHCGLDGIQEGTIRSVGKLQLLLVNGIQAIYHSQGVFISNQHLEIIVRQMTSKVKVIKIGASPLLMEELVSLPIMNQIYEAFRLSGKEIPKYEPKIVSITSYSLRKKSFLAAAGFQETRRVLTRAAIEGKSDWFRGLKESIIVGRLSPSGSAFLNYKNNLDHLYSFKK